MPWWVLERQDGSLTHGEYGGEFPRDSGLQQGLGGPYETEGEARAALERLRAQQPQG
jgi:hypothetical protein